MQTIDEIKSRVREVYTEGTYPETDLFVDHFKKTFGDALLAVVFYGSCLSDRTRSDTSFLDFYLIADDYKAFHKKWSHAFVNGLLPPAIFYLELKDQAGQKRRCKYCVISLEDLEEATSHRAKDVYHLGRFSKRIAILYSQQNWEADRLVDLAANAWQVLTPHALNATSTVFTISDFAKSLLALSYRGEVRLEETDKKVQALYEAEKDFYDLVLTAVLENYIRMHRGEFKDSEGAPPGEYEQRRTPALRAKKYRKLDKLLARSRRRAKMRWPLLMFTVDGWVDILLGKLERTYGTRLQLKPYERKFILIFGWRHYFRLRKEGKVK